MEKTTTDPANDPEIKARYELHKAKQAKKGKDPLPFKAWLTFYLSGRAGGLAADNQTAAGKSSAAARKKREAAAV